MKRVLLVVFGLIVFGCNLPPECSSTLAYPHWTEWTNGKLISIVDDSLAVLTSRRYKKECKSNEEEETGSRSGLFLVNYRTKQKPLSVDTVEYIFKENNQYHSSLNIIGNYFKDSSVLVLDNKSGLFGFWKIGTESIFFKKYTYQEDYALEKANTWINESILFKNSKKSNTYNDAWDRAPMLNTKTGQIEILDFLGEYKWLDKCLDVSYVGEKIVCIKINNETNKFELVADGIVTDEFPNNIRGSIVFSGNYIIKNIGTGSEIYKIDTENFKLSNTFIPVWVFEYNDDTMFFENIYNPENFVQYTPRDLFGASN